MTWKKPAHGPFSCLWISGDFWFGDWWFLEVLLLIASVLNSGVLGIHGVVSGNCQLAFVVTSSFLHLSHNEKCPVWGHESWCDFGAYDLSIVMRCIAAYATHNGLSLPDWDMYNHNGFMDVGTGSYHTFWQICGCHEGSLPALRTPQNSNRSIVMTHLLMTSLLWPTYPCTHVHTPCSGLFAALQMHHG